MTLSDIATYGVVLVFVVIFLFVLADTMATAQKRIAKKRD